MKQVQRIIKFSITNWTKKTNCKKQNIKKKKFGADNNEFLYTTMQVYTLIDNALMEEADDGCRSTVYCTETLPLSGIVPTIHELPVSYSYFNTPSAKL